MKTVPNNFTIKTKSDPTIYLVQLQKDGTYKISWPKEYPGDPGETVYSAYLIERYIEEGSWKILENLDNINDLDNIDDRQLSVVEKCAELGLTVNYRKGAIEVCTDITRGVSVNSPEGLEKLVDILYEYRVG